MDRSARIASILDRRKPLARGIEVVEGNLTRLQEYLHRLDEARTHLLHKLDDPSITGKLQEINFSGIYVSIASELEALTKLKNRFSRDTLNIGVVGRARQGKSRLLQSLTGLTRAEIPDGDRQHCTGVRSTIHHNPSVETYGEVWFHTERSFLDEVIAPYYEKLHLGSKPLTVRDFATRPLPILSPDIPSYAEPKAMYEHLKRYHEQFDRYGHLLRESSPLRIQRHQIREYVAQDTIDGQRDFFNYLAVKEVKITCDFPKSDVGKIALVDMPGLGDTGIGDEERLIKALGKDIDFVLFVRMPKSSGDYWADVDVRLYDVARSALVELPIDLWSFVVLNQTSAGSSNGDNTNNCQDLLDTIDEKHIKVNSCLVANCASVPDTEKVLDSILGYLIGSLTDLDRQYASACQDRLLEIREAVNAELNKARAIFELGSDDDYLETEELFSDSFGDNDNGWWRDVALALQELRGQLWDYRQVPNDDLHDGVLQAIELCEEDKGILSAEDALQQIGDRIKIIGAFRAYPDYQDELRVLISHRFLSLDQNLKDTVESVKERTAKILKEEGNLSVLSQNEGSDFFIKLSQMIPDRYARLKGGFEIIADFQLSYRGLILPRIRQHLDGLTNISAVIGHPSGIVEPSDQTLLISKETTAEQILTALEIDYDKAIYTIKPALEELLCEPNEAAYAMVEEFIDNIIRQKDIQKEWKNFLRIHRGQIWTESFGQKERDRELRKDWLEMLDRITQVNQTSYFTFIN
jgi:hypothetical protein